VRITPVSAGPAAVTTEIARATATAPVPAVDVEAVGDNDIFQANRSALPSRYRMPGEAGPATAPAVDPLKPVVLGTVVATDGAHFATCQLPGGRPTIVHVGERFGDYTVMAIQPTGVVFKTASGTLLEVASLRPGSPSR
jgi:hypothetical protein